MKQKIKRGIGMLLFLAVAASLVFAAFHFWGENQSLQQQITALQGQIEKSVTVTSSNVEEAPQEGTTPEEGAFVLSDVDRCRKDAETLARVHYDSSLSPKKRREKVEEFLSVALKEELEEQWKASNASTEESVLDFKTDYHLEGINSYYNILSPTAVSVFVSGTLQTNVSYSLELDGEKIPISNSSQSSVFFCVTFLEGDKGWKLTKIDQNLVAREETGRAPSNT